MLLTRSTAVPSATIYRIFPVMLVLCMASLTYAQNTNAGDIRGTVADATGAVIPGVAVTLLNTEAGVSTQLVTSEAGLYDAVSILPGKYRITFSKDGFEKLVRDGITLKVGALTVDATLSVGTTQQEILVTAEATLLKTETGEQSTTFTDEALHSLPNVGQDWSTYTRLLPGANGSGTS